MKPKLKLIMVLTIALGLVWAVAANAQLTVLNSNMPAGFIQAGFIQAATLKAGTAANRGGSLYINGIRMIVPDNSVVQMPTNTLTWAELFDPTKSAAIYDNSIPPNPTPPINHPAGMTGLALSDVAAGNWPGPFPSFNATVIGNIDVKGTLGFGVGAYIVGLILPINQDLGNSGQGFITHIDYEKGRFEIGGRFVTPGTGLVVEINDPVGRFGKAHSPDPRWTTDSDNPTVTSVNGYPMGIPKVAPPAIDPDRPFYNRPKNPAIGTIGNDPFLQVGAPLLAFNMPASAAAGTTRPDPWKHMPFLVGDHVIFTGTLCKRNPSAPITSNFNWRTETYISANTVTADNLLAFTAEGPLETTGPAYVVLGVMTIGNDGAPVTIQPNPPLKIAGGTIPAIAPLRDILITGWCTDSDSLVDIYAVDFPSGAANPTLRLLGTVLPSAGLATAPAGKWTKGFFVFAVDVGNFLPATRQYAARSRHGQVQLGPQSGLNGAALPGLQTGRYSAFMFEYAFMASPPGFPIIPNNLQTMPFLFSGEGLRGPLTPFPPFTP